MSRQRIHLSLGGEAGGRSPGFILASEVPLRSGEVNASVQTHGVAAAAHRIPVLGLELLTPEPTLHSNAWAAISARETPVLLFGGRLHHPMRPPLWLAPSRYLWTSTGWPCRLGCRRL